jgi:hypothetical protein
MYITKCDICSQINENTVHIRYGLNLYDLCEQCGESILKFIEKSKLTISPWGLTKTSKRVK